MKYKLWQTVLIPFVMLVIGAGFVAAKPFPDPVDVNHFPSGVAGQTVIVVNTTGDPDSGSLSKTCNYDQGGLYHSATPCSLRRALIEASARPPSDRPIIIGFGIPKNDPNYDSTLDAWTIVIEDDLPPLKTPSITNLNGQVLIDGDLGQNQVGGRTDAPRIIVDTRGPGDVGSYSLEVESENNIIRNLAWKGGGSIILKEDNNEVESVWVGLSDDGQLLALRDPLDDPADLGGGGGIVLLSNNNVVSNTVVAGSKFGRAINVDGDDNLIANNFVGTRAGGTVPEVAEAAKCLRSLAYDPANWYGGWGIQIGGSRNMVLTNTIAGLHITQSANETPPMALEVAGADHLIQGNRIGVDSADNEVGVCGIGILIGGSGTDIVENEIVRSRKGFEEDESDTAIYVQADPFSGGQLTMRYNLIKDGPSQAINFTADTPSDWRLFEPAKITGMDGDTITGTNGDGSPCPNCQIDLYLDDLDEKEEVLEVLGTITADANGNFVAILPDPLPEGYGIRTGSTTTAAGIIGSLGAGTSTRLSELYTPAVAPTSVTISGPIEGEIDVEYTFDINVSPVTATTPFTYTIEATGIDPIEATLVSTAAVANITWTSSGSKTVHVTATNEAGSVTAEHTITIAAPPGEEDYEIYLPMLTK